MFLAEHQSHLQLEFAGARALARYLTPFRKELQLSERQPTISWHSPNAWAHKNKAWKPMSLGRQIAVAGLLLACCPMSVFSQERVSNIQETKVIETDPNKLFEPRAFSNEAGKVLNYRLLKPLDYNPSRKYPLVVFLHGAGERGDDNTAQLVHGMADFCQAARRQQYPCYVLAPQCPSEEKWVDVDWSSDSVELPKETSNSMQLVLALVDSMIGDAAIDKNRIYITGLSMGGYGTWDALARRPDFFAAAVPICGSGDPATAASIKHIPIWCFHGDKDGEVNVQRSRDMITALKQADGQPKYTEYAGVEHDSWTQTYSNDELYSWLFSQRRTTKLP